MKALKISVLLPHSPSKMMGKIIYFFLDFIPFLSSSPSLLSHLLLSCFFYQFYRHSSTLFILSFMLNVPSPMFFRSYIPLLPSLLSPVFLSITALPTPQQRCVGFSPTLKEIRYYLYVGVSIVLLLMKTRKLLIRGVSFLNLTSTNIF